MLIIESYRTIANNNQAELIIKKSQFIGQIFRVTTEAEVQAFLTETRRTHHKANHNCFAYQLGLHNETQRSSDDGEPSGTAGAPILNVLQQEQLCNVLCIVTRYFGGIKLGAGGLIRAYGQATTAVVNAAERVIAIPQVNYQLTIDYDQFDILNHYLREQKISNDPPEYAAQITIGIWLDLTTALDQITSLKNLLNGRVKITERGQAFHEVPLVD